MLPAEIAQRGVLTNYGDSAMLTSSADGNSAIVVFVVLAEGKWLVTAGPKTIDNTLVAETAPPLADQIRTGGKLSFVGEQAYLNVSTNTQIKNADGGISYSSSAMSLPFELGRPLPLSRRKRNVARRRA